MNADDISNREDLITPGEIREALKTSGYLLEGRIGALLETKGFSVEFSSFRADPRDDHKSIEIDVCGRDMRTIDETNQSYVVAEVMIECKNNAQPVVFFMREQAVPAMNSNKIMYGGCPLSSADPKTGLHVDLCDLLAMNEWHHYCREREVSTQFCGFTLDPSLKDKRRNGKPLPAREDWRWKAEARDDYSNSFSNMCYALASDANFITEESNIELKFYYPIWVFQGPIYKARVKGNDVEIAETNHLQFHHAASIGNKIMHAQIDIVSEKAFPSLVDLVQREIGQIVDQIKAVEQRLLDSAIAQKYNALVRIPIGQPGRQSEFSRERRFR